MKPIAFPLFSRTARGLRPSSTIVLTCASLLGSAAASQAAVLVSEDFTYTDGALTGQNGGTGFSNAWSNPDTSEFPPTLNITTGVTTGNAVARRDFSSNTFGSTGTIWLSFDWGFASQPAENGSYGGLTFYISGAETFLIGNPWPVVGHDKWSMSGSAISSETNYGGMKTAVAKITLGTGATSTVDLWVGATGASVDVSGAALLTVTNANLAGVDGIRIGGSTFGANVNQSFDNLVIGTTMGDVDAIPEPSAALLGGLGMLCLLRRRRA
jgi:hypothetical protein